MHSNPTLHGHAQRGSGGFATWNDSATRAKRWQKPTLDPCRITQRHLVQHDGRRSNIDGKEAATGVPYASTIAAAVAATRSPFTRCAIAQLSTTGPSVDVVHVEEVSVVVWGVVVSVVLLVSVAVVV